MLQGLRQIWCHIVLVNVPHRYSHLQSDEDIRETRDVVIRGPSIKPPDSSQGLTHRGRMAWTHRLELVISFVHAPRYEHQADQTEEDNCRSCHKEDLVRRGKAAELAHFAWDSHKGPQ
jgi:hypothetical protein